MTIKHAGGIPSLETSQGKPVGTRPLPSTPYQEGFSVQGLQRQPAALGVEAQLQALGRRVLSGGTQTRGNPPRPPPPCPRWYLQGTVQLPVMLSRMDPLPRCCRQHGQGVMPEQSEEAVGVREEGCEPGSRVWPLAQGLCEAPEVTSSSRWAEQPAPK